METTDAVTFTSGREALAHAVQLAGGQLPLARKLTTPARKIRQGHVWGWLNRDKRAPADLCAAIEHATGVRCEELRPDLRWSRCSVTNQVMGYFVGVSASAADRKVA